MRVVVSECVAFFAIPLALHMVFRSGWRRYVAAFGAIALCSLAGWVGRSLGLTETNIVMIFLAGIVLVAAGGDRGPSVLAAVLGVLSFDLFFVEPILGLHPNHTQYFITLGVMLGTSLLISELMARLQAQLTASRIQERQTDELYRLTQQLSRLSGPQEMIPVVQRHLEVQTGGKAAVFLIAADGETQLFTSGDSFVDGSADAFRAAAEAIEHRRVISTLIGERATRFVPLVGTRQPIGALSVSIADSRALDDAEPLRLVESCANLLALSLERDQSLAQVQRTEIQVRAEEQRSALLSAVSHELRTPLSTIAAAAESLLDSPDSVRGVGDDGGSAAGAAETLRVVVEQAHRLARQVDNLLDMAKLDGGPITVDRQPQVVEEVLGVALTEMRRELASHHLQISLPADLPLVNASGDMLRQLFVNLLENGARYSPTGSTIAIAAEANCQMVELRVTDNGPGIPPGSETSIFERFIRGKAPVPDGRRGVGLGLAICKAIVAVHGGTISARNLPQRGAEFTVRLPAVADSTELVDQFDIEAASD